MRVTCSPSWGCAGRRGAQGPLPHVVKRGRRGQILSQMGKLVPGAVSLPLLALRNVGKGIISPCCQSSLCDRLGRVYKNLLVETISPTSPSVGLCSFPATSQQSPNPEPCVFHGLEGGEGRAGWPSRQRLQRATEVLDLVWGQQGVAASWRFPGWGISCSQAVQGTNSAGGHPVRDTPGGLALLARTEMRGDR